VSLATISRYLPKPEPLPGQHQRWMTFLRNHKDWIAGMDFFVVPTVRFQLLYVWFALDHGRRRVLHFNVGHRAFKLDSRDVREVAFCPPPCSAGE
jgi:putative transposase